VEENDRTRAVVGADEHLHCRSALVELAKADRELFNAMAEKVEKSPIRGSSVGLIQDSCRCTSNRSCNFSRLIGAG
jgi:hypothetical protein